MELLTKLTSQLQCYIVILMYKYWQGRDP